MSNRYPRLFKYTEWLAVVRNHIVKLVFVFSEGKKKSLGKQGQSDWKLIFGGCIYFYFCVDLSIA